jgi:hypothetical protein
MIHGAHFLLYSKDPDADRAFLRDVIGLKGVDIGHGWIIAKLPPAEIAVHPAEASSMELYFMCDDLDTTVATLREKGASFTPVEEARWGRKTTIPLPSGAIVGLYQPYHQTALGL